VDGLTVNQLGKYLKRHWLKIRASILDGTYQPLLVRRKDIPKPDGGVRLLGIPAVVDRVIQQAIAQVLQYIWEPVFPDGSFGFRPGRCQHDAIAHAKSLIEQYLNYWIMRRLRAIIWKHWKNRRTRIRELEKRGVYHAFAVTTGCFRKGAWRMSRVKWVMIALSNAYFKTLGLYLLS